MPRQRAPRGRDRDRADRRAVVDVLLARAHRGALTPAEGALLATHVRTEQRLADETRHALAGTTRTLDHVRAAADAAIVETEQRAEQAEQQARRYRLAWRAARRDRRADRAAMAAELPLVQAVARVRALAADMRTWCSPHGIATAYAERIEQALATPGHDHNHDQEQRP